MKLSVKMKLIIQQTRRKTMYVFERCKGMNADIKISGIL